MASMTLGSQAIAEAVTVLDWQLWESLPDSEKIGIAPYCAGGFVAPVVQPAPTEGTQFLFSNATTDKSQYSVFRGDVEIHSQDITAFANQVSYDPANNKGTLDGDVILRMPSVGLSGNSAQINLDTYYALLKNAQFVLHEQDIHGTADEIERTDNNKLVASKLTFTRCLPSSNAWNLRSSKLTIDNDEGIATAWNSRLEVQHVPIMYIPYISFPLNDQARTGLLVPTFGSGYSQPYYLNLAPNYDDTITVDYQRSNGTLLRNEFRFLTPNHNGINEYDYQVVSGTSDVDNTSPDSARWALSHKQSGQLTQTLGYNLSTRWVSDQNFDLVFNPGSKDKVTEQILNLSLNQKANGFSNSLAFAYKQPVVDGDEKFETLDTTLKINKGVVSSQVFYQTQDPIDEIAKPVSASEYEIIKIPEVTIGIKPKWQPLGIQTSEQFRYGYFSRTLPQEKIDTLIGSTLDLATTTDRFHSSVQLTRPYKKDWGYFQPTVEGFATHYMLDNDHGFDLDYELGSNEFTHLAWRASIDQGLTFKFSGDRYNQSLKPRLYYAYSPLTDQLAPVLDTEVPDNELGDKFSLFSRSRFSSIDRIGDMSRLSTSLSYDLTPKATKRRIFSASAQKGIKLAQERLTLAGVAEKDDNWQPEFSDWKASASIYPTEELSFSGSVSVAHEWDEINLFSVEGHYQPADRVFAHVKGEKKIVDSELIHSLSAGAYFPIRPNVALVGYALAESELQKPDWSDFQIQQLLLGIDYDNCCWNVRFAAFETPTEDDDSTSLYPINVARTYKIEVTLKGIGVTAGNIENLLNRLDFGYSGKLFNYR